jgi:dephospho-CoA kinase
VSTTEPFAIVGLTGGIASGKSTVSEMFSDLGVPIIDADLLARQVVEPGEPALDEIREAFGDEVINQQGALDREALGEVIFSDEEARQTLEQITHPRIARRMQQRAAEARQAGEGWVIYDAALIVENGLHEAFDALVVVAADPDVQIERLTERDGISEQEARGRLDAQMPLDKKVAVADYVIDNNGSLAETRRQVDSIHEQIERGLKTEGTALPDETSDPTDPSDTDE